MTGIEQSDRTKVRRVPKRGVYDRDTIYSILDKEGVCQVAFVYKNWPVVIPMLYGRKNDSLFIHGASAGRMITELEKGAKICLSVTRFSGLVLARSAFHHSANYESVVLFGRAELVSDAAQKAEALKAISDHLIPGRWEEVRPPNSKEMKATKVLRIPIVEASAKIRRGGPVDDEADYALDVWAGVLPFEHKYGQPIADDRLMEGIALPGSVRNRLKTKK